MTKRSYVTGWDIGGAHVKAARVDPHGQVIDVIQVACPLWLGLNQLEEAINTILNKWQNHTDSAAITMTGELVDLFSNRQQGVEQIIKCVQQQLTTDDIKIYGVPDWLTPLTAKTNWQQVASMNWHASAKLVSSKVTDALFIDIGSTTCDIIPVKNRVVCAQGLTDFDRQISRELLYTGTIRTPLIALSQHAPFRGNSVGLAAELFATTGDCWVLTNQLEPSQIQDRSADGQPWDKTNCCQRLARLLGTDAYIAAEKEWQQLAQWFTEQQQQHIISACRLVIQQATLNNDNTVVVGAGIGRFMLKFVAESLQLNYLDLHTLLASENTSISDHAPATAVALLAAQ
jgi:probable H4MPT-linked C1 transfer pathway protein